MFSLMPHFVRGCISGILFALNTIICCSVLCAIAVLKVLIPVPAVQKQVTKVLVAIAEIWVDCNHANLALTQNIEWNILGIDDLHYDCSYLVMPNHRSWIDIVVLQKIFNRRIPFLRFFLKQQLIWVPFLGTAWWALDFPFMRRYSREYLEKHPEKRGEDLRTTRRACEKFRGSPISVLNFLEGTRFTKAKQQKQNSPFSQLLIPRAGGIAFVLSAMGDQFDCVLDVCISYPHSANLSLWNFLNGRIDKVVVQVRKLPIPQNLLSGDYLNDPEFRAQMQNWLTSIWSEKNRLLEARLQA